MIEDSSVVNYVVIVVLLILSALFSGLTLGLMSLSSSELKRKAELGDEMALKILSVRKNGNLLLTTLLIGNVAVNSILSVFLGSITTGIIAASVSTALIVVFGEIIPQAVFSRYAMSLGARVVPLVRVAIFLFYPIAYPISKILDYVLGDELPTIYSKDELIKLIQEHEDSHQSDIDEDEERILTGALTFSEKVVKDVMTSKEKVFFVDANQNVDFEFIKKISSGNYSRFPVFFKEKDNVIGVLHIRSLLEYCGNKAGSIKVSELPLNKAYKIREDDKLDEVLDNFLKQKHHMFIVYNKDGELSGIITLEDIIEEILRQEILDEKD